MLRADILAHVAKFDTTGDGVLVTGDGVSVVLADGCRVTTVLDHTPQSPEAESLTRDAPNKGTGER